MRENIPPKSFSSAFTLLELLIVAGILSVLSSAVVYAVNPIELLKSSRDSTKIRDFYTLNKALELTTLENISLGSTNTVYVSLPGNPDCSDLNLPALRSGWSYACSDLTNFRKLDGSGWIPVNFESLAGGSPISSLPVDNDNTSSTGRYYMYGASNGLFELNLLFESTDFNLSGKKDIVSRDGGDASFIYEVGTSKTILPFSEDGLVGYWNFDEGSGDTAKDSSGKGNDGELIPVLSGGVYVPPSWAKGKRGGAIKFTLDHKVRFADSDTLDMGVSNLTVSAWVYQESSSDVIATDVIFVKGAYSSNPSLTGYLIEAISNGNRLDAHLSNGTTDVGSNYDGWSTKRGAWRYLTVTYNRAGNINIYIDGKLSNSATGNISAFNGQNISNNDFAYISSRSSGLADGWLGMIDDMRIMKSAWSKAEIIRYFDATK